MIDREVTDQLERRVSRLLRKSPKRIPGKFKWTFRDENHRPWVIVVVVSRPAVSQFDGQIDVDYEVISPTVKNPKGGLTLGKVLRAKPKRTTAH